MTTYMQNGGYNSSGGHIIPDDSYGDDYQVSSGCRNYSPKGNASIMNMADYSTCDNCRHLRQDNKCGIAERTLA